MLQVWMELFLVLARLLYLLQTMMLLLLFLQAW